MLYLRLAARTDNNLSLSLSPEKTLRHPAAAGSFVGLCIIRLRGAVLLALPSQSFSGPQGGAVASIDLLLFRLLSFDPLMPTKMECYCHGLLASGHWYCSTISYLVRVNILVKGVT